MASFRFLHCADLHIDSPLRGLESDPDAPAERIRNATREAVVNVVDYAIEAGVAFVLAAGDLYDGDWPDWRTGQFLIAQIGRLNREGIPFIAIRGNHDAESVITRHLAIQEPSKLLTPGPCKTVELDAFNVNIYGRSYADRAVTENLAASYPPPTPGRLNIGLLHTAVDEGLGTLLMHPARCSSCVTTVPILGARNIHRREVFAPIPGSCSRAICKAAILVRVARKALHS